MNIRNTYAIVPWTDEWEQSLKMPKYIKWGIGTKILAILTHFVFLVFAFTVIYSIIGIAINLFFGLFHGISLWFLCRKWRISRNDMLGLKRICLTPIFREDKETDTRFYNWLIAKKKRN